MASGAYVLAAIAGFSEAHPNVKVTLSMGNSQDVLRDVLRHEADVGVVADVGHPQIVRRKLSTERVIAVVHRGHRWRARRRLRMAELAGETLIEREAGSRTRAIVRRALSQTGVAPAASIEVSSREAVLEAVSLGLGVGFVFASGQTRSALTELRISDADMDATEYLICRRNRAEEVAIAAFSALLGSRAGGAP